MTFGVTVNFAQGMPQAAPFFLHTPTIKKL